MKKKLLGLLMLIALLIVVVAYACFSTDIFKSEKQMFFKYALGKNVKYESDELYQKLIEYLNKKNNEIYTNDSEVLLKMNEFETEDERKELDIFNNKKIAFKGKTIPTEKLSEQIINMNLTGEGNSSIKFKRDEDLYGIQTDLFGSKFITIRNENLQSLASRFNLNLHEIPDKIYDEGIQFNKKEINTLKDKYLTLLSDNLGDELFCKEKIDNQTIIKLDMTSQKIKDIVNLILETLRKDEIILGKFPTETKDSLLRKIDELDTEINSMINENESIQIKVYIENNGTKKYEIMRLSEEKDVISKITIEGSKYNVTIKGSLDSGEAIDIKLEISRNENNLTIKMDVKLLEYDTEILASEINMTYKNLFTLDNVEENIDAKLLLKNADNVEVNGEIDIKVNNKVTFGQDVEIQRLDEEEIIMLNDIEEEEFQTVLKNIYQKLGLM